jgi:hypothetical protein
MEIWRRIEDNGRSRPTETRGLSTEVGTGSRVQCSIGRLEADLRGMKMKRWVRSDSRVVALFRGDLLCYNTSLHCLFPEETDDHLFFCEIR